MQQLHPLFERILELQMPTTDYAVFGSGPMYALGLVDNITDLDIIARGAAWDIAVKAGKLTDIRADGSQVIGGKVVLIDAGTIEVFQEWFPKVADTDQLIDNAFELEGIPLKFVEVNEVLKYKEILSRTKDETHINVIKEYIDRIA